MEPTSTQRRFRGASPFRDRELDRRAFFGRQRECRSLLHLVRAEQLVVLFAKSGMGKSSLINAGLKQPLRQLGYFPMVVRVNDPSKSPVSSVVDGVLSAARDAEVDCSYGEPSSLWSFFRAAELWSERNDLLRPVLILDQFEELFTLHQAAEQRDFSAQLAELLRGSAQIRRPLPVLLALREDFLAHLDLLTRDTPSLLQNRFRLGPLQRHDARIALEETAALEDPAFLAPPFAYTDDAMSTMLDFLGKRRWGDSTIGTEDVDPFQLQLLGQHTEETAETRQPVERNGKVQIDAADLGDESQMRSVLGMFYVRTIGGIPSRRDRRRARRLCERGLISPSGRRLSEDEEEIVRKYALSTDRLNELVDSRLLRAESRFGGRSYELSHDTLVDPILEARKRRRRRRRRWVAAAAVFVALPSLAFLITTLWQQEQELGEVAPLRQTVAAMRWAETLASDVWGVGAGRQLGSEAARSRLEEIESLRGKDLAHRQVFGAVMFAFDSVAARAPELGLPDLAARALELRTQTRDRFIERTGRAPPTAGEDEALNWRVLLSESYLRGHEVGDDDEKPPHRMQLSPFLLQIHEVTNREYRRFDPGHEPEARDDHPVVNVSWYEAVAYAAWLGGRLPTEAEWESAARGEDGREYPWPVGHPLDCRRANMRGCEGGTARVCSRPAGNTPEGLCDLAGNLWEWTLGDYGPLAAEEVFDPRGGAGGASGRREIRGGSFHNPATWAGPWDLVWTVPWGGAFDVGFRVVMPARARVGD